MCEIEHVHKKKATSNTTRWRKEVKTQQQQQSHKNTITNQNQSQQNHNGNNNTRQILHLRSASFQDKSRFTWHVKATLLALHFHMFCAVLLTGFKVVLNLWHAPCCNSNLQTLKTRGQGRQRSKSTNVGSKPSCSAPISSWFEMFVWGLLWSGL